MRIIKDELAENRVARVIIEDENSARPVTIFVRSFNFTLYTQSEPNSDLARFGFGDLVATKVVAVKE